MIYYLIKLIRLLYLNYFKEPSDIFRGTTGGIMLITVNGETNELKEIDLNLSKLLELRKVESPEMVAVQLNGQFVEMNNYPSTYLKAGDDVEFLFFMGGGSR